MPSNRRSIFAGLALAALGVLAGLALGSGGNGARSSAQTPAVEVRTQVIRRTVNVYRHAKPTPAAGAGHGPGARSTGYAQPASISRSSGVRTGAAATGAAPVTRTSGARGAAPQAAPTPRTRTSGAAGGGTGSTRNASTRTSGGGEDRGHHDD